MTIPCMIPDDWAYDPPRILVVGDGLFSKAFSQVMEARLVMPSIFDSDLLVGLNGKLPRVLNELSRVFVIVGADCSAAETACINDSIWKWVVQFTEAKEEHLLAMQFILPPCVGNGFRGALVASLALSGRNSEDAGFGFSCMSDGLAGILAVADRIRPKDFVELRNRRNTDIRRSALERFRAAAATSGATAIKEAAESVAVAFFKEEHLLDVFCRKPSHPNGHRLRFLLNQFVTDGVTQDLRKSLSLELPDILI